MKQSRRPEPKSKRLVLVTDPSHPPRSVRTRPKLFEISCTQTDKQIECLPVPLPEVNVYLCHQRCAEVRFSPLSVCMSVFLLAGYVKKLWKVWVCHMGQIVSILVKIQIRI